MVRVIADVMPRTERTILAFSLAPLLAPIVYIGSGTVLADGNIPSFTDSIALLANTWTYAVATGYFGLLILGIPTLIALRKFGVLQLHWLAAAAAVHGAIATFVLFALLFGFNEVIRPPFSELALLLIPGSITAVAVAVAFWYISGHNWPLNRTQNLIR
jgi:hypothetical protein